MEPRDRRPRSVSHNEAALTAVRDRRHSQRSAGSGSTLVARQAAAALVLLLAAAVANRSARAIDAIDLGFEPRQLITLNASAVDASGPQQRQLSHDLLTAVRALPGVTAAAAVSLRPLQGLIDNDMSFLVDGQRPFPALDGAKNPIVVYEAITPEYFRTMGASILRGRDFTEGDKGDRMPVVIVSEGLARMLWRGDNPIGKRLQLADAPVDATGAPRWSTVVGVAGDIRYRGVTDQRPDLYIAYSQTSEAVPHVMVRTSGPLAPLIAALRAAARRLHPQARVDGADTMTAVVERATATWNLNTCPRGVRRRLIPPPCYAASRPYVIKKTAVVATSASTAQQRRQD